MCDSRRKPTRDSVSVVDRAETPWSVTGQAGIGGTTFVVFITRLRVLQLVYRHHLRQTFGLSSLLLGGHVCQTPQACVKAPASWETGIWPGGRTIRMGVLTNHLGSITTSYLVHG